MRVILQGPKTIIKQLPNSYIVRFVTHLNPVADAYWRWVQREKPKHFRENSGSYNYEVG